MKKKYLIPELLCVLALAVFIVVLCISRSGGTEKEIAAVATEVAAAMEENQMAQKSSNDALKVFGFDMDKTDGVAYFANDSIMDVSELLIIKLKDPTDAEEFKAAIRKRVTDQQNLYKDYAPQQYSLLKACIIEVSGNTVFYCTAKNAGTLYEAYKKAL